LVAFEENLRPSSFTPTLGHDHIDALDLDDETRHAVLEGNARRVYPRLDALLTAQGR
jgi:hypothetical protein